MTTSLRRDFTNSDVPPHELTVKVSAELGMLIMFFSFRTYRRSWDVLKNDYRDTRYWEGGGGTVTLRSTVLSAITSSDALWTITGDDHLSMFSIW